MKDPIITGQTNDGTPTVFTRLFQFKDQEGLPIDITAAKVRKDGFVTDWLYEVEGALWLGWTQEKILTELSEVFLFIHPEKRNELLGIVKQYFIMRETPNPYTLKALKATKP